MEEDHPNEEYFGDSVVMNGHKVISQKCQLCGKELAKGEDNEQDN